MLLAININNTETKVGLFRGDSLEAHWRLTTAPARTPDEWAAAFTAYLLQAGRSTQEVRAAIVASVVPPVTQGVCEAVELATTVPPVIVDGRSKLPLTLDVDEPLTVGADRILNTLAASHLFRRDTIVVDFGTATTFDCITGDGRFTGGTPRGGVGAIGCCRAIPSPTSSTSARPSGPSWRGTRPWATSWRWASREPGAGSSCPRRWPPSRFG